MTLLFNIIGKMGQWVIDDFPASLGYIILGFWSISVVVFMILIMINMPIMIVFFTLPLGILLITYTRRTK